MKTTNKVAYFPVLPHEQALLERVRSPDLAARHAELLELLDLLAEHGAGPADLEQALQLLDAAKLGEGLGARFENLEARLVARIEKGLQEIEGRLSKWVGGGALAAEPSPAPSEPGAPPSGPEVPPATLDSVEVPEGASLAFVVDGELIWSKSGTEFYRLLWAWLFEHGHASMDELPIRGSKKRHEVAAEPVHPSGKAFFAPKETHGIWIEAHASRASLTFRAKKHLKRYGVPFKVLVGPEE